MRFSFKHKYFLQYACKTYINADDNPLVKLEILELDDTAKIQLMPQSGQGRMDNLNLNYQVDLLPLMKTTSPILGSTLLLEIRLTRLVWRSFTENIAPPGLLVAVSWVRTIKTFK